jgi:hypothetical protein
MKKMRWWIAILLILACNLPRAVKVTGPSPTRTPAPPTATAGPAVESTRVLAVELPATQVEIDGTQYQAYQVAGDPFRFLCPEPCAGYRGLIYSQYAGFKHAREALLKITGVDTLRELQPVDIHLLTDSKCTASRAGATPSFAGHDRDGQAYICSFIFDVPRGTLGPPYSPQEALRLDHQAVLIHQYMQTIFYGRVEHKAGAMSDFVTPIALYVTGTLGVPDLCTYHPATPPGDYGGWLIYNLCRDNDFRVDKFAPIMITLDRLYRRDDGRKHEEFEHLAPSMAQFREIFDDQLPGDPREAFRDACWPADLFEDIYTLRSACTLERPTVEPTP